MLLSTFLHLKGVGEKTERSLWERGILTWNDYSCPPDQAFLLPGLTPSSPLDLSLAAYQAGNIAFFAKEIPTAAYYRLALTYPDDTLFLDIETTGLSLYYDIITLVGWSRGDMYDIYINGQDDSKLRAALHDSKIIVTFNGTVFDLKFIEKYFPDMAVPPVHIDLRFLSKKVGLVGGQKAIERIIGYKRHKDVDGMLGEAAPILWHKYRRGDAKALKRLIEYNHEDIEGMKHIFDSCISKIFEIDSIPTKIRSIIRFSDRASCIKWKTKNHKNSSGIFIPKYQGSNKPLISYDQLNNIISLDNFVVVGIDLVSSEERESGCCKITGNVAHTCRLRTDDEIINWSLSTKANLISIDSPLSVPIGRISFFDSDPYRDYGIMRKCERILKKRGVNVYPCLIQSMQKLTRRGMALAEKFRQKGIPVIESYPGAAQDIISIPRKQAGLTYLVQGLHNFGIQGDYVKTEVSHDELDAITSSIVGLFFWAGMFEALGNPLEEYLIIPDLNGDHEAWLNRTIIGVNENLESREALITKLHQLGFSIFNWQNLECLQKSRNDLKERAKSLTKEMGINIDLRRKWLGKELIETRKEEKKMIIHNLNYKDDFALMIESFGPSFKLLQNKSDIELMSLLNYNEL